MTERRAPQRKTKGSSAAARGTQLSRKHKALVSRRRMLATAHRLFCERGFAGTTMDAIAAEAGLAVQTLYFTFHNKVTILNETLGAAIMGFEAWDPAVAQAVAVDAKRAFAEHHAWYPAFASTKAPIDALGIFVDASLEIFARVGSLPSVLAEAAAVDAGARRNYEVAEARRVEGYELVIEQLAKRAPLKRGLAIKRATDILLTIVSVDVYRSLIGRGWNASECRRFLLQVLSSELLG